jgi:tRNA-Thr(GGU) m(6)t(6)A37 methyltransferase TsaA
MSITLDPIGFVRGGRDAPIDDHWGKSKAKLELDPARFSPDALAGLTEFSHVEVIFVLDRVPEGTIVTGTRHPRNREDWPLIGIFAQRGRNRPNRLGVTVCKIIAVHGVVVEVEGLDAIDGTPILDIKPVMRGFLPRGEVTEPAWATALMEAYW